MVNGNPSGWLLYLSDVSPSILNIPYYQAHLVSFLPQAFFHRALVPFSGRWYLETKILVLGVLEFPGEGYVLFFKNAFNIEIFYFEKNKLFFLS